MSMMDSELKKRAEKATLIRLAAPFLKVLQAICVNGADGDDADKGAADNNADNDADVKADNNAAMQMMDDDADHFTAHRQQTTTQWTVPRPRQWATMQMTGKDTDDNNAAADINAAMQTIR